MSKKKVYISLPITGHNIEDVEKTMQIRLRVDRTIGI